MELEALNASTQSFRIIIGYELSVKSDNDIVLWNVQKHLNPLSLFELRAISVI